MLQIKVGGAQQGRQCVALVISARHMMHSCTLYRSVGKLQSFYITTHFKLIEDNPVGRC